MSVKNVKLPKGFSVDYAWLGIAVDESTLFNPLERIPPEFSEAPYMYFLYLMQRPEYFYFVCKYVLNITILPMQAVILKEMWDHKFPMLIGSRGLGKSFLLAVYVILRMLLLPGRKVVICGAGFRQSKIVFQYMESIWRNAPVLRSIFHGFHFVGPKHEPDMWRFHLGDSIALAIPIGDGGTIRGLRANDIIADEFASITREIFEVVIKGFAAVRSNPIDSVQLEAANALRKRLGLKSYEEEEVDDTEAAKDNQMIISGTAYYDFNHFAEYWKKHKKYIELGSTPEKLFEVISREDIPESFDETQYTIIRIPYNILPKGFMDDGIVLSSKLTSHTGLFQMEYGAVFSKDSYGFFKRSLIESCTVSPQNEIVLLGGNIMFHPVLKGNPNKKYVYAVDPASEVDKFAITVLELHEDHRRIVYVWSTNRKEFNEKVKAGVVKETDYYGYCARKIRDLMKTFPCERIAMDSQGGGVAVNEALHDKDKLIPGEELPIWPIMVPGEPKETDGEHGLHILELINFSDSSWVVEANHGLKKDMEDKVLIFPYFDSASLGMAEILDGNGNTLYDTLEDCYMEIEELKNELSTIVHTQSNTGRDRWDTPEIKLPNHKKGRLRKDRYSALLMANMTARKLMRNPQRLIETEAGGFARNVQIDKHKKFDGPAWITESLEEAYS